MNKPIDPKKKIHSNNYMSFFIKCDILPKIGKGDVITQEDLNESIKRYYNVFLQSSDIDKETRKDIKKFKPTRY